MKNPLLRRAFAFGVIVLSLSGCSSKSTPGSADTASSTQGPTPPVVATAPSRTTGKSSAITDATIHATGYAYLTCSPLAPASAPLPAPQNTANLNYINESDGTQAPLAQATSGTLSTTPTYLIIPIFTIGGKNYNATLISTATPGNGFRGAVAYTAITTVGSTTYNITITLSDNGGLGGPPTDSSHHK